MPWTGDDTKDVFKKVLGGLIAASILSIVYAVVEKAEWYYAAILGLLLVTLIAVLVVSLGRPRRSADLPPPPGKEAAAAIENADHEAAPKASESRSEEASSADSKVLKKALKAEQKRRKKEAKSRDKES